MALGATAVAPSHDNRFLVVNGKGKFSHKGQKLTTGPWQ